MLTPTQRDQFFERGFTRVEGAIPPETTAAMVSRIWEALQERQGMLRDDRSTWIEGGVRGIGDLNRQPPFRPFGTAAIKSVIDQLLGHQNWAEPSSWGQILATFPAAQWSWNSLLQDQVEVTSITWHTDYPYDTPKNQLAGIQIFGLLGNIDSGGGGTMIIEGSHQVVGQFVETQPPEVIEKMKRARVALMKSDPWLQSVSKAVSMPRPEPWIEQQRATIGGVKVCVGELTGKAGDVYFTHPWLLHATSPNCNQSPRLMCTQRVQASS